MTAAKTRCFKCVNANKKATETPCSRCGEVQFSNHKQDNHFLDASKNFMKEIPNEQ